MKQIGVVGCGTMGAGIVELLLQTGHNVVVREVDQTFLEKGLTRVRIDFDKLQQKGKITSQEKEDYLGRLKGTTSVADLADSDLVIEAIVEEMDAKKDLLRSLDVACKAETILATNTSSLSVTEMAGSINRRDRFLGLHFFNPATIMPLVEVVRTIATSDNVLETVLSFVRSIGKTAIVAKDNAGFIVNLFLTPFLVDAMRGVGEGVASVQDIDLGMKLGCNHPMGPLMLSDFIGLDVLLNGMTRMFEEYKDKRYAPPPILKRLVLLGDLGQKTGKGFYDWSDPRNPTPRQLNL